MFVRCFVRYHGFLFNADAIPNNFDDKLLEDASNFVQRGDISAITLWHMQMIAIHSTYMAFVKKGQSCLLVLEVWCDECF